MQAKQRENEELKRLLDEQLGQLRRSEQELKALTDNLPGGIMRCNFDEALRITYVSDGFLELFGYTREEIRDVFGNSFLELIHPDDRSAALASARKQISEGNTKELEYRAVRKDGSAVWILDRGQLVRDEAGNSSFYCILLDNTDTQRAKEALRRSVDRFGIVMDQTSDIIFSWDLESHTFDVSANWRKKFRFSPPSEGPLLEIIEKSVHIFPDDIPVLLGIGACLEGGRAEYLEGEFRIHSGEDEPYRWYRVRATLQRGARERPQGVVGILLDIDEAKRKYETLVKRAERDALTGLYNRGTMQALVEERLAEEPGASHAFLIIDIDDFKILNDTLGHLYGDAILADIASGLRGLFRSTDLIGRIGGDEFAVFLAKLGREEAAARAAEVLDLFRRLLEDEAGELSCSVGIALTGEGVQNYAPLYQSADTALYLAKKKGKNRFAFFDEEMSGEKGRSLAQRPPEGAETAGVFRNKLAEYVFELFYRADDVITAISRVLEVIGTQFDVSRVYIFENSADDTRFSNTFEWCNDGVTPEIGNLQDMVYDSYDNYAGNFNEDGVFYRKDLRDLPLSQREVFDAQGIKSVLQCAIMDHGRYRGFVGFDECRKNRFWTKEQIETLSFVAQIIGTFLIKERASRSARQFAADLEEVLNAQASWIYVVDPHTYEVLYLNKKTTQLLGVDVMPEATTCYELFFGAKEPCPDCPLHRAQGQKGYHQKLYSKLLDREFMAEVSPMQWGNRQGACVVTARELEEEKPKS